jgi:hypothetical protein
MRRTPARLASLSITVALAAALTACGGSKSAEEKAAERVAEKLLGDKVDIDRKGDKITFKGEDGDTTVEVGGGKPKDWPSDVPLPDGKITSSVSGTTGDGGGWTVTMDVGDPFEVIDTYREQISGAGFEITQNFETGSGKDRLKSFIAGNSKWTVTATVGTDSSNSKALFVSVMEKTGS